MVIATMLVDMDVTLPARIHVAVAAKHIVRMAAQVVKEHVMNFV